MWGKKTVGFETRSKESEVRLGTFDDSADFRELQFDVSFKHTDGEKTQYSILKGFI